ncbi:GMP synthase [Hymenopellis radicata]|nr:GMP synthase [Hymenopellis radicata]
MAEIHDQFDTILILDFGSQYSHLITRRCREHNVYAELMPCTVKMTELKFKPKGVILSGSPYSVYDADAPHEMAFTMNGTVSKSTHREYGFAKISIPHPESSGLFEGWETSYRSLASRVWMSHSDHLTAIPPTFTIIGSTENAPFAAIAHKEKPWYGIQFHPEVTHSARGKEVIGKFILGVCGARKDWTMEEFIGKEIARIREICGPTGRVIGAVSGGVDSTVAAKLMHEAIGDRFHAIMVDNGVLRLNEATQVYEMLNKNLGVNLTVVDASELFLSRLEGVEDPEKKRKIIGGTFINVFEEEAKKLEKAAEEEEARGADKKGKVEWLLQGTLYPDVIESISFKGPSATIKTHHNVGGLLKDMKLKLIEPLRELFKDEVRALGRLLSIPAPLVQRHPFPGPGLAIRILGPVNAAQVKILQHADSIYIEEIRNAGLYDEIAQAFAVLLPVRAVGVMGDARTYEQVIALRAVQSEDFMTADWYVFPAPVLRKISSRITNEVPGINRVTYDISSKPPATVEWL